MRTLTLLSLLTVVSSQLTDTAIDFSVGEVGEDGAVCVEREEEREKVEQELETQCTQQNVTQAEISSNDQSHRIFLVENSHSNKSCSSSVSTSLTQSVSNTL